MGLPLVGWAAVEIGMCRADGRGCGCGVGEDAAGAEVMRQRRGGAGNDLLGAGDRIARRNRVNVCLPHDRDAANAFLYAAGGQRWRCRVTRGVGICATEDDGGADARRQRGDQPPACG